MKVYCVFRNIDYECSDLYHVFYSEDKAKLKVEELTKQRSKPFYEEFSYEEMEVE